MSWIQEWQVMLQLKSDHSFHSYPADFRPGIYDALRMYCLDIDVIYFPAMYEEYIAWDTLYGHLYRTVDGSFCRAPNRTHLHHYHTHSSLLQQQIDERNTIRRLEQFVAREKIHFHGDSIIEKISLAAYYLGLKTNIQN